ncbi:MAG TPA: GDSL-type esterase/lipase family protein [Phenylobacterium sp.]|nr:GDSL-type esterase/lipase family protein [Phenylobacterium sp.]
MRFAGLVGIIAIGLAGGAAAQAPAVRSPERFAPEIAAFAAADSAHMPPACGFLFVGSSSIRFWAGLDKDMAPLPVLNRGFGGSEISDVDYYFDRVVAPYHPRAIVFYAGENDISDHKTPDQVLADFTRFMDLKTKAFGAIPVYFVSVKPSKLRFEELDRQAQVNAKVQALAKQRDDLHYIDVVAAMLENGKPRDIYRPDNLHMTPVGYAIWTRIIRPVLIEDAKRPATCKAD